MAPKTTYPSKSAGTSTRRESWQSCCDGSRGCQRDGCTALLRQALCRKIKRRKQDPWQALVFSILSPFSFRIGFFFNVFLFSLFYLLREGHFDTHTPIAPCTTIRSTFPSSFACLNDKQTYPRQSYKPPIRGEQVAGPDMSFSMHPVDRPSKTPPSVFFLSSSPHHPVSAIVVVTTGGWSLLTDMNVVRGWSLGNIYIVMLRSTLH